MSKYDLTNNLEVSFMFSIHGKEYEFRKPTVREMRAISKEFSSIDKEENEDKKIEKSEEAMKKLYSFVKSIGHEEKIADVMENQPMSVQIAFNDMVRKELGAE